MAKHHFKMAVTFLFASGLTACGGAGGTLPPSATSLQAPSSTVHHVTSSSDLRTTRALAATPSSPSYERIDAGGGPTDANWIADTGYSGGYVAVATHAVDTSQIPTPAPQSVYQTQRWGMSSYSITNLVPGASYSVRTHFVESYFSAAGKRIFNVKVNGVESLTNFDIFAAAGGANRAIVRSFASTADASGTITLAFTAIVNHASIAGIEITETAPAPTPNPVAPGMAIDAGGNATGRWLADTGYNGGWNTSVTHTIDTSHVSNAAPTSVYQTQRVWTNLAYSIPGLTPDGSYTVRLHFAETFFTSAGQRIFSVSINGTNTLADFDIFQAAGGSNIAVIKQFATSADSSGKINIRLYASVNNAAVAGIEIIAGTTVVGPSPVPTASAAPPTPVPTSSPVGSSTCVTSGNAIYSGCFKGNTPFHHTFAQLQAMGAINRGQTIADHYWAQGIASTNPAPSGWQYGNPIYFSTNADPAWNLTCPAYGTCNAATSVSGKQIHLPAGDRASIDGDHHLSIMDLSSNEEVDMWGGANTNWSNPTVGTDQCEVGTQQAGTITCSWGGAFSFAGDGLAKNGNAGVAGGYALGLFEITAGELMQGHIDHAIGIQGACLDNGGVYPSIVGRTTDVTCSGGSTEPEPTARYGDLFHLKSTVNIGSLGYSHYCQVILKAFQIYGAYEYDNNNNPGSAIHFALDLEGNADNSWFTRILPSIAAAGDASNNGNNNFSNFQYCLQRIPASDIEVFQISSNLPPA